MKKFFTIIVALWLAVGSSWAFTEQFKVFESGKKTNTCRTNVVNITNEREPLFCTYVFTPFTEGRKEGTLLFEFLLNPNNEKSMEIKDKVVEVLKDLKEGGDSRVVLTLEMSDGERLYFDASDFRDWNKQEWRQLLRVTYDKATSEWRTQVMFPLEHLWSNQQNLSASTGKRHKFVLNKLQNFSIRKLLVTDIYGRVKIELEVLFERPTDGTFSGMVRKCKK